MSGYWINKWKNEADRNLRIILEEFGRLNAAQLNYSSHIQRCSIIEILTNLSKMNEDIIGRLAILKPGRTWIMEFRIRRTRMLILEYALNHRCLRGQNTDYRGDIFELLKYQQQKIRSLIDNLRDVDLTCTPDAFRFFRFVKITVGESIEYLMRCQWEHITQARRILMLH